MRLGAPERISSSTFWNTILSDCRDILLRAEFAHRLQRAKHAGVGSRCYQNALFLVIAQNAPSPGLRCRNPPRYSRMKRSGEICGRRERTP